MANSREYGEPRRSIRIPDELWEAALATAAERKEAVPEVVRDALEVYAVAPEQLRRYLARHRKEQADG